VKLTRQPVVGQRAVKRVDAVRHVKRRAFVALREKISHRTVHRARQPDADTLGGDERERSVDAPNRVSVAAEDPAPRLAEVHVGDVIEIRIEQIDDATDGIRHGEILR
jgi:hypothetical protein